MNRSRLVAVALLVMAATACSGDPSPSPLGDREAAGTSAPTPPTSGAFAEPDPCPPRSPGDDAVVDALLGLFAETPIVAFGEHHGTVEEHRILRGLVCDPRFADAVDAVVVEFGNERLQPVLDRYIDGGDVTPAELADVWQESTQRSGVWDAPVYRQFLTAVRSVNQGRPPEEHVRVLAGDPPINWATITGTRDCNQRDPACLEHWDRDENFADVVVREVLDHDRTALLIAGAGHMTPRLEPGPPPSIPQILEATHPGSVSIVLTHATYARDDAQAEAILTSGPAPALFLLAGSPLGAVAMCFVDDGENCAAHSLAELADAYLYLGGLT